MNTELYYKVLRLDSLAKCLDWEERIKIHLCIRGKYEIKSVKILRILEWITDSNWKAPSMGYSSGRLLYFYHEETEVWHLAENYLDVFPKLKEDLTRLTIKNEHKRA